MLGLLWTILVIVLVIRLIGLIVGFAENRIHLLLIVFPTLLTDTPVTGHRSAWLRRRQQRMPCSPSRQTTRPGYGARR